jgi:hypothetical protein
MSHQVMRVSVLATLVAGTLLFGACAASPRQRPVGVGDVSSGQGSLEATRKALEGTWTLTQFEVAGAGGKLTPVRAKAQLTYDGFGNLSIKGVLEEPLPGQTTVTDQPALAYTGRVVIDTVRQEMVLMGTNSTVEPDASILAKIGLESRRKYTLNLDNLTIAVMDAKGGITSRSTFRK